jgi:hypothetical protein
MPKSDRIRLQHMLDAAREALSFVRGKTREHLDQDRLLVLALVKAIEIIGKSGFLRNSFADTGGSVGGYHWDATSIGACVLYRSGHSLEHCAKRPSG